uniref:Synaptobrevin, longin-like domain protein n=1 Tax=Tanacetum cinerariifolium TaxID=118510 RepID=A0A6L2MSM8_TANCI|nr:hypothetical protein [Tanacetum cinerariifolium]
MIAILDKYEQNANFHQIVDFVEASYIRYALTFNPTVYVSHIRQFWSTARIETTDKGTKIVATVDGKLRTISESSIRRNLKLKDEAGISSLHDTELFENLTLMGYNILPNQKFSFQKGQFSHQWKYLIHTIMQCLSPKSTGFNEFSSNIAIALVCLATNRVYNFSKMIFDGMVRNINNKVSKFLMYPRFLSICLRMGQFGQITHTHTYAVPFHTRKVFTTLRVNSPSFLGRTVPLFDSMLVPRGEGSGTSTEPHHTPSPEDQQTSPTATSSPSLPPVTTATIPTFIPTDTPQLRHYTRGARIAQSLALLTVADEPTSPLRDDSQGEACPTITSLEARQGRANIIKTSTLPYKSTSRVTSLTTDKGNGGVAEQSEDDAPIKGRSLDEGEEAAKKGRSLDEGAEAVEKGSDDTEEMVNVLTSLDVATILSSEVSVSISLVTEVYVAEVPTGSGFIPTASPPGTGVPTGGVSTGSGSIPTASPILPSGSGVVPTASPIFTTATVATQYTRRKEEEMERDAKRMNEQIAKDAEIAKIHAEEEFQIMIDGLDRNNETVAKYLQEYYQFAGDFPIRERIELISDLVKYQDNYAKDSTKKQKTLEEVPEEKLKEMMQLVLVEDVYVEALQVELKRLYEPAVEDQLWTHTQNMMHSPVKWKLYDTCGVHHVIFKDQEIFMLMEKDYPLRKALALVMICYKLQVKNYSKMANDLIMKIYKIANSPS